MSKYLFRGDKARDLQAAGLSVAEEFVGDTMGPGGRPVLIDRFLTPSFTKDGNDVLNELEPEDPVHKAVVKLLRDATSRGVRAAGDGTTSTTVLANAMVKWGLEMLKTNSPREVVAALTKDINHIMTYIKENAKPVKTYDEIYRVAYISTNGDAEMAETAAKAVYRVGEYGKVILANSVDNSDNLDAKEGVVFNRGCVDTRFLREGYINNGKFRMVIVAGEVGVHEAIQVLANTQSTMGDESKDCKLIVMATSFTKEACDSLLQAANGRVIPVRMEAASGVQMAYLMDLAALLNVQHHTPTSVEGAIHVSKPFSGNLSMVDFVVLDKAAPDEYIKQLHHQLNTSTDEYDRTLFGRRIARLSSGVVTIFVSGDTDAEQAERKARYDDATKAAIASTKHGSSIGGGYVYINAMSGHVQPASEPKHWCTAPIARVLTNAHICVSDVLDARDKDGLYLNVATGVESSIEEYDVEDAAMAQLSALQTAGSIARMIILSNAVISGGVSHNSMV